MYSKLPDEKLDENIKRLLEKGKRRRRLSKMEKAELFRLKEIRRSRLYRVNKQEKVKIAKEKETLQLKAEVKKLRQELAQLKEREKLNI